MSWADRYRQQAHICLVNFEFHGLPFYYLAAETYKALAEEEERETPAERRNRRSLGRNEAEDGILEIQCVNTASLSRRARNLIGSSSEAEGDVLETQRVNAETLSRRSPALLGSPSERGAAGNRTRF